MSVPDSSTSAVEADVADAARPLERLREAAEQRDWLSRWAGVFAPRLRGPTGLWVVAVLAMGALGVGLFAVVHTTGSARRDGGADLPMAAGAGAGNAGATGRAGTGSAGTASEGGSTSEPSSAGLVVQVAGAVARPGVFHLAPGARVGDLVGQAGGLTAEADADRVDLAAPLVDGALVYIPRRGESGAPGPVVDGGASSGSTGGGAAGPGPAVVDLNSATADQLDSLPGVGPATAAAILTYRRQHGPFHSIDDLTEVSGIGPAKLAQIRPHVRV